jgi:DNA transformation protein
MTTEAGFIALLEDLLAPVGPIRVKRMFGGAGIYAEGVMFAIVAGERVYFKTDEAGSAAFEDAGTGPFTYSAKSGTGVLKSFWQVPDLLIDEPDEFAVWARRAIAAARKALQKGQQPREPADVPQRKPSKKLLAAKAHRGKTTSGRRLPRG